ncbi:MAG TPA: DUF5961 family protein [Caulobacteraceae bacterium]
MTRRFIVHARHLDAHHARTMTEPSFEAAAIAYAEGLGAGDGDDEISLIVRDLASGREHCFRIDLVSGETSDCG